MQSTSLLFKSKVKLQWCCPLLLISLQVPTAMLMHHAVKLFPQEIPSGSTPAPSVVVTTARTPATGRETALPPVPVSKTVHLSNRLPSETDSLWSWRRANNYLQIHTQWWLMSSILYPPVLHNLKWHTDQLMENLQSEKQQLSGTDDLLFNKDWNKHIWLHLTSWAHIKLKLVQ